MWIVLLDHSGSMGDPFERSSDSSRRTKIVDAEIKLEAAKEVLREEIREFKDIHPEMSLAIFAFTSETMLVYEGPVADLDSIDLALQTLTAENGTDIAAALNTAADYKAALKDPSFTQLVLISDGKSDRVEAMAAARRCVEHQLALSMLLIDPTDEGKAFARDVVRGVGGTYQPIVNRGELKEATKGVSGMYTADLARAERYLKASAQEAQSIQDGLTEQERVKFTSAYPGRIVRDTDYSLRVYLHIESQLPEVLARLERIADQFGTYPRKGDVETNQRIPIGTRLEVTPRIHSICVNPPQQPATWTGFLEELGFRIHYAGAELHPPPCSGFIDISTDGLLLAQIPVSIQVETGKDRVEQRTVEMMSRVFASYSHKDESIVRACKAVYRGLGIQLFVDKDDILSGQVWRDVLRQSIANHDLFQLFWSLPAAESDEVANEWKLAKEVATSRSTDFIRPLFWTLPMPEPPVPLKDLHFARLDLEALRLPTGESGAAPVQSITSSSRKSFFEARFPILATVDSGTDWVSWLQEQMGVVVSFLEDLVRVRLFPPAIFLVDEQVVQVARRELTIDPHCDENDILPAIVEMLQALALAFHIGKLAGPEIQRCELAAFFDAGSGAALADYKHVVSMAEWFFSGPTRDYLAGRDIITEARRTLMDVLQSVVNGESEYNAGKLITQTLEKLSATEHSTIINFVTEETLNEFTSFDKQKQRAAAILILESDLPRFADQYAVFEFFHRVAPDGFRNHKTFPEYLDNLVRQWLIYVRIAKIKRPGCLIDVGYTVSQSNYEILRHRLDGIDLKVKRIERTGSENPLEVSFEMSIESYERCITLLSELLLKMLAQSRAGLVDKLVTNATSTHGIYLPASASNAQIKFTQTLARCGWPENATLPGQHKVLLCMGAIERLKENLIEMGSEKGEADALARRFCISVLLHEHFHAAAAAGLDAAGRIAIGAEYPERWAKALPLNESLAVWCEWHFFRAEPKMLELINGYIAAGNYPAWPYRGAEVIESFFAAGGTPSVRGWIRHLRDDPENAQREFDQRTNSVL
jgi:hypothetical protein